MSNFLKQKNKKSRIGGGFTLVETLVALSIFSMSILSVMVLLSRGISSIDYAKQKLTAAYLVQEGIEYTRNMRDTFMLYDTAGSQAGWDAFITKISPCVAATGCYFSDLTAADYTNNSQPMAGLTVTACGINCPTLYYDPSTGKYNTTPFGINSGLIRRIRVNLVGTNELQIFSRVFWTQGSGTYSMGFSEVLYNWAQSEVSSTVTPVSWTSAVGVVVSGNNLTKAGPAGWDAGAVSTQSIAAGNGYVEFTASETTKYKMGGLGFVNSNQSYTDIEFAIYPTATGALQIYETGTSRGTFGTYAVGDVFRVAIESGQVKYYKNGVLLYTSSGTPSYPLYFDTSLYDTDATIINAKINDY